LANDWGILLAWILALFASECVFESLKNDIYFDSVVAGAQGPMKFYFILYEGN
jgi:hypothetical protein